MMEKHDISQPIHIQLDKHNYKLCAQAMCNFLKRRHLSKYISGHITKPIKVNDKTNDKFVDRLKDWDNKNYQIITWFCNQFINL